MTFQFQIDDLKKIIEGTGLTPTRPIAQIKETLRKSTRMKYCKLMLLKPLAFTYLHRVLDSKRIFQTFCSISSTISLCFVIIQDMRDAERALEI